jgi:hypothetical protein
MINNSKIFIQSFFFNKTKNGIIKICFFLPNSFFLLGKKLKTEKISFNYKLESANFSYFLTTLDFFIQEHTFCGFQAIFFFSKKDIDFYSFNKDSSSIHFFHSNEK